MSTSTACTGTVVEVGQLEGEAGAHGFVINRLDGGFITVKGLTQDETRAVVQLLFQKVELKLETPP